MPTKAPPKFVENAWAWSYTLDKMADKDMLDAEGNPKNYAAACAIYKNVANKYGDVDPEASAHLGEQAERPHELTRAEMFAIEGKNWVVSHGSAFAVREEMSLRLHRPGRWWIVELYADGDTTRAMTIADDVAEWITRHDETAQAWVQSMTREPVA